MQESKHRRINESKWDKWAGTADGKGWVYDHLRQSQGKLIEKLNLKENLNFLDIGCGTGWAVGQVAKLVSGNGNFFGVDLSGKMIEKAKQNFKDHENFHFVQASAQAIPLENDTFDMIICTNSFHHYLHPENALKEMYRLLKSGGRVYILDPTADTARARFVDKIFRLFDPAHVKMYSTAEFRMMIERAGLLYLGCDEVRTMEKIHMGEKK
jgi:ubiquinone/menaquinone biosynthesis C-methylase UbiE